MTEPATEPGLEPAIVPPTAVAPQAVPPIERVGAAFEVLLCSGFPTQIVILTVLASFGLQPRLADGRFNAPVLFALTLLDTLLMIGLVLFFFRAHRESFREELFNGRRAWREVLYGVFLIPASFGVLILVMSVLQFFAPWLRNVPVNPLAELARNRSDALIFAFVVVVAGGVREEIQRGFILRRFERFLGGGVTGIVIFSCLFGLGHLEQGRDVAIVTAVLGAFWGATFLARRSIVGPMVGHAGFNLTQVAAFLARGTGIGG